MRPILSPVVAIANAPPPAFSGGGKWEAMHGRMGGVYEVRVDGPNRHHQAKLSEAEYDEVLGLVREFQKRNPRNVAT
jgi:hypothetical protein